LGIDSQAKVSDPVFMYITVVPNRGAKPTTLLRQSYREDKRVKNRTLANLSHLPPYLVETMRRALQGDPLMKASEAFAVTGSEHHGHVEVVLAAMERLGFARLVASERSGERDLIVGMVAARLINPTSRQRVFPPSSRLRTPARRICTRRSIGSRVTRSTSRRSSPSAI
jgi:hypothetical protein